MTKRRRNAKPRRTSERRPSRARSPISTHARIVEPISDSLPKLAALCSRLLVGFGTLAKHARSAELAAEAASLSAAHRAIADEIADIAVSMGMDAPRVKATCGERLRWEWLASSGRLIDGAPESRLLAECIRLHDEASVLDTHVAAHVQTSGAARASMSLRQAREALERVSSSAHAVAFA